MLDKMIILKGDIKMMNICLIRFIPKIKYQCKQLRYPLVIKVTLPPLNILRLLLGCQCHYSIVSDAVG